MHHPCRASASLKARLGNPGLTCFQVKQAARSRHVLHTIFILPSVLWRNRQIIVHLVLRPKSRNHRGDFVGQITKPQLPVLTPKPGNPSKWLWCQTTRTVATGFEAKPGETVATGFEAKPEETVVTDFEAKSGETVATSFEAKPGETVDLGFEAKPRNSCSSSPYARCRPYTTSPNLSIL
jgi:hypothetical protein